MTILVGRWKSVDNDKWDVEFMTYPVVKEED